MKGIGLVINLFLVVVFSVKLVWLLLNQYIPSKTEVVLLYVIVSLYFVTRVLEAVDSKEK